MSQLIYQLAQVDKNGTATHPLYFFFLNLNINNLNIQIMWNEHFHIMRIIITAVVLSIMVQSFLGDFKLGYDYFFYNVVVSMSHFKE